MNPSEEIKSRLDIVDVIREYIQLKPAGVNFSARCPFHNEKSASFMVSPDKQIWHCFGCGKGGDVFSFVMEIEGLSFVEVLRELAPKAGVELKAENSKDVSERNRLLDIMAEAVNYYHHVLLDHPLAAAARAYLEKRGLTEEMIEDWKIGFSLDDWEDLVKHLSARGYKDNEIFLAGLSSKKEGSNRFYNRFRGRIMFPINDINGNPVAFTARVTPASASAMAGKTEKEINEKMALAAEALAKVAKYVNSPQTAIYDKGRILFGLDKAKQAIKQAGLAVLVEGQMDVITAHQYGYKNVVASSGTALTEAQVGIIKRFTDNIALAFDSDSAGQGATSRGGDQVSLLNQPQVVVAKDRYGKEKQYLDSSFSADISLKVIEIPNGKDPDECIKTDQLAWEQAVKQAKPIMQYYFDKTLKELDLRNIEDKRKATKVLLPIISKLANKIEREAWIRKLAVVLQISENLLFEAMPAKAKTDLKKTATLPNESAPRPKSKGEVISELVLALSLHFPEHFGYLLNHLELLWLEEGEPRELYKSLVIYYNQNNDQGLSEPTNIWGEAQPAEIKSANEDAKRFSYQGLHNWLAAFDLNDSKTDSQAAFLDRLMLLAEKEFYQLTSEQGKAEIIRLLRELKKLFLTNELKRVETDLANAEKDGQVSDIKSILEEFKFLSEELRDVNL